MNKFSVLVTFIFVSIFFTSAHAANFSCSGQVKTIAIGPTSGMLQARRVY